MKAWPLMLVLAVCGGCAKANENATVQDDTIATVPVGPGTEPDVIQSPDTPGSRVDTTSQRVTTKKPGAKQP